MVYFTKIVSVFFLAGFLALSAAQASFEAANFDKEKIRKISARVDTLIQNIQTKKNIKAKALASDSVFVRRLYLDLAGRVPTYEESVAFLESKEADKREKLVYSLLQSEWYVSRLLYLPGWQENRRRQGHCCGSRGDHLRHWTGARRFPHGECVATGNRRRDLQLR